MRFAVLAALGASAAQATACYGIAFSGGDMSAAYQAGVLKGLVEGHAEGETAYTYITGMGGAAVNGAILADTEVGQEAAAASSMITFWQDAADAVLGKDWIGGVGQGLLLEGALYNDKDVLSFLKSELPNIKADKRWFDMALTDMTAGASVDEVLEDYSSDIYTYLNA
jgi:predicted acylesterase/phospholipase RssA